VWAGSVSHGAKSSPFWLYHESFNLLGSVVHPSVPQRSFIRLPDTDWPDGGRCCF